MPPQRGAERKQPPRPGDNTPRRDVAPPEARRPAPRRSPTLSSRIRRLLDLTNLTSVFEIYATEADAIAEVA